MFGLLKRKIMKDEILHIVDSIVSESDVHGKGVLEAGSRNVNGSIRSVLEKYHPLSYIGIDLEVGDGVDYPCDIYDLVSEFGKDQFDVVACMETLEHVADWRLAIFNLKNVLEIEHLEVDVKTIVLKIRKPLDFQEAELSHIELYAVRK